MSENDKFKFTSSFLKKPFLLNNNNNFNDNTSDKEASTPQKQAEIPEKIQSENSSKINYANHDNTYSISDQRPQTSQYNRQNISNQNQNNFNNLSISTLSVNNKKRKPFENLTFYSEKKNNLNINKSEKDDDSIMTDINNINNNSNINQNNNNTLKESQTEFNFSQITQDEKSMIISSYKLISKETIEKAKKLNKQFKQTPFWIKFFEEIENNTLKNNSSYFKINNKNEYIKNLVNMIQKDADLYDKLQKSKKIKIETENEIKKFIEENNNNISNNINESNNNSDIINSNNIGNNKLKRYNSSNMNNIKNNNKKNEFNDDNNTDNNSDIINQTEKKNEKNDIAEKFAKILESYNKLDEKEKKIYLNEENYESFKFKLITGGKFNSDKDKKISEKNENENKKEGGVPLDEKNILEKLEKPMTEKEKKKDEIMKIKGLKEFKTIDMLYFGDNYTFEELNYNKIDFYVYNKESLPKILALDKRLHELDPERYKTSINTELKKIQDEFNLGKEDRMKKASKEIRDLFNKYMEDTKETKKTIFDIKPPDNTRIKYKDYLHYNDGIKKERKELKNKLNKLDDKIKDIYSNKNNNYNINNEEYNKKLNELNQQLEKYHSSEEYKEKYNNMNVLGLGLLNRVKKEINEFESKNKEIQEGLTETKKLVELREKQSSKEEIEKFNKEVIEPFNEYEKEIEKFDQENKADYNKVLKLEEDMKKEEELLEQIQKNLEEIEKNKKNYEDIFEQADKIMMENDINFNENNNDNNINNDLNKYEINEIDEIQEEKKKSEEIFESWNNKAKDFEEKLEKIKRSNENGENELKNKKFMSVEEFCKNPQEVEDYLNEQNHDNKENAIMEEENEDLNLEDSLEINQKEEINQENNDINNNI